MLHTIRPQSDASDAPIGGAPRFVHLKVHSAYSLLEGALTIPKLAKLAAARGFPALGLTDTNNLFGALEFSDKLADAGIQPVVGCTLQIDFGDRAPASQVPMRAGPNQPRPQPAGAIALLAANARGYQNLMKLSSRAFFDPAEDEAPHIMAEALEACGDGLIALTGGPDGPIDKALREDQKDAALERLKTLERIFGDRLYVEIQRHGLKHEIATELALLDLAYARALPIVATNEVYFASPDDYEAHDALLCIAEGAYVVEDDRRRLSREHFFKSAEQMAELFADLPEALANTVEIAQRCAFRPRGRKPILPRFVTAAAGASDAELLALETDELRAQAEAGLKARLVASPLAPGFTAADYEKRLAFEIDVIAKMKFPGYFLIVADFIKWAKANGIPVGPGRGSGAGSVVAWALTITDLDPLRFGLLFERFLNPERISMPDFDIDFCQDRRDEVIRYVQKKYGADRVAQIITHGKLQARAVLRDVGRVLQMPYGQVDKLCKLVPNNPANPVTLPQAIEGEPKLQEARDGDPMVARLLEIAQKLEGLYRHASTHAAGMVIGDRPLDELVPLYRDPKSSFPITQFNWKLVEAAGLVKFDFLGLKTLTVLQKAVALIKRGRGIDIDLAKVPLDDKRSYELLARADTVGVFQLEGTGMRDSLKRLRPDRFEDIIAMVALYRPGPMDNIPTYINRKHGEEPVDCLHPLLEPILKETYGVIIYQEQVMQIAQVLAGYSLGEADLLRRAMGKKDKNEMARQKSRFVDGATKNGVKRADAEYIFELVDKFAGYGFNKSHAAAYALVSYHTAYLKANFREEFLAASMTLDMGNTDKLAMYTAEARRSGITIEPPCVNASEVDFLAEPPKTGKERGAIRYSLAALKNIGAQAVESLVAERAANGPYKDLSDFAGRCNTKAINKRGLETLSAAGAFDIFEPDRALVHGNVDQMLAFANRQAANEAQGTSDLFGGGMSRAQMDVRPIKAWTPMEKLQHEFEAVGFFLSGHPLDAYASVLAKLGILTFAELEARSERGATAGRLAGIVVSARERRSQKGNKFAFAMFSEPTGQFEAVIFSETLAASRHLLEPGTAVLVTVEGERDGDTLKLRAQGIESLDQAANSVQRGLKVVLDRRTLQSNKRVLDELKALLRPGGKGIVCFSVPLEDRGREVEIAVPGRFDVSPAQKGAISTVPGVLEVVEI
ncbi:MAG: DNA polymerase III subunit alpha [Hyphomicrobiaceae bacterium]|nr:MAG: DNA polymerase III subunit alpha [Hyphomicrobiaceae bacterium]